MSPASSGTLEVERYIGACLISQNRNGGSKNPHKVRGEQFYKREHFVPDLYHGNYVNLDARFRVQRCHSIDGWAGGMPLISFANNQRRGVVRVEESCHQSSPLARLAVHTQGAPLILTKSYNHRKNKVNRNNTKTPDTSGKSKVASSKCTEIQNNNNNNSGVAGADTISVASDESSGSGNSENCLPRIIKPRKRRKKDRKPPLLGRPLSQDGFSTDSASPEIDSPLGAITTLRPLLPFGFDPFSYRSVPDSSFTGSISSLVLPVLSDSSETPKLHHSFEDVEEPDDGKDINGNQSTTTCQCRYCDPTSQIWDVDRNCYSPFLTPPGHLNKSFQFPNVSYLSPSPPGDDFGLVHSMSSVSLDEEKEKPRAEGFRSGPTRDLEVSTEIVTSHNGHRDLEIKFFSSPSAESVRAAKNLKPPVDCVDSNKFSGVNNVCREE